MFPSTSVSFLLERSEHLLSVLDFERDPAIYVDSTNCPTASSLTRIKCSFFGAPITTADATNVGQYTGQFHVVIAGSNTYTTAPQPQPGYTGPVSIGNASIISPTSANTYMGKSLLWIFKLL